LFAPEGHDYTSALQDRKLKLSEAMPYVEMWNARSCGWMEMGLAGFPQSCRNEKILKLQRHFTKFLFQGTVREGPFTSQQQRGDSANKRTILTIRVSVFQRVFGRY
jgi:hypothetical protein